MAGISPQAVPATLAVAGTNDAFVVRRVYCVDRNYALQADGMCGDDIDQGPVLVCRPTDIIVPTSYGETLELAYPSPFGDYRCQAGLIAVIGKGGSNIEASHALEHVWGYAVGLGLIRYDLQARKRELNGSWEIGKVLRHVVVVGPIRPARTVGHFEHAGVWLVMNDLTRHKGDVSLLTWSIARSVAYLSQLFPLERGDLIYMGTLEGGGALRTSGDLIVVGIDRLGELSVQVS